MKSTFEQRVESIQKEILKMSPGILNAKPKKQAEDGRIVMINDQISKYEILAQEMYDYNEQLLLQHIEYLKKPIKNEEISILISNLIVNLDKIKETLLLVTKQAEFQSEVYTSPFGLKPLQPVDNQVFIAYLTPKKNRFFQNDPRSLAKVLEHFEFTVIVLGGPVSIDIDIWKKLTSSSIVISDISQDHRWITKQIIPTLEDKGVITDKKVLKQIEKELMENVLVPNLNTILEGAMGVALGRQSYLVYEHGKNPKENFFDIQHIRHYGFPVDDDGYIDWSHTKNDLIKMLSEITLLEIIEVRSEIARYFGDKSVGAMI